MSNAEPVQFLGNKTSSPNDFPTVKHEESKQQETTPEPLTLCHYCQKKQKDVLNCKQCKNSFCFNCINELSTDKEKVPDLFSPEEKNKWVCFICNNICPCITCKVKREQKEKKCLLCKGKTPNLVKIDDKITKLNLSEQRKAELIGQKNSISLLLQDYDNVDEKYICKTCSLQNVLVKEFLNGGDTHNEPIAQKQTQQKEEVKKEESKKKNLPPPPVSQSPQSNRQIPGMPNFQKTQLNYPMMHLPQQMLQQSQGLLNDFKPKEEMHNLPLQDNFFSDQFPGIQPQNFQNGQIPQMFPISHNHPQPMFSPHQYLSSSFTKIFESLQKFNDQNIQNNNNVYTNANQLSGILSQLHDLKKDEDKKEENPKESTLIKYLMTVIEDLKKQISLVQHYTKIQKEFIQIAVKELERLMQQVNNQQLLGEYPKGPIMPGQIQPNPSLLQPPFQNPIPGAPLMNDLMKTIPFQPIGPSIIGGNIQPGNLPTGNIGGNMINDLIKPQFPGMPPNPLMVGVPGISPPPGVGVGGVNQSNNINQPMGIPNLIGVPGVQNMQNLPPLQGIQGMPNVPNLLNYIQPNKKN